MSISFIMFIDIYGTLIEKFSFCSEVIYSLSRDGSTVLIITVSLISEGSLFIVPLYFTISPSPLRCCVAEGGSTLRRPGGWSHRPGECSW